MSTTLGSSDGAGLLGPDPDSPPPAGVHSLWRLRGYLRPYVGSLAIMLVASLARRRADDRASRW